MVEDGNALLADIHERITDMMQQKVEAVKVLKSYKVSAFVNF